MKTLFNYISFIIMTLALASCSSKTEYTNAIPHDASALISIDVNSMIEKSGLNNENGKVLVDKITDALKSGLSGKSYKLVEKILNEPSASGISFKDKMYIFSCPNSSYVGLIAKVNDEGDVEDIIETMAQEGLSSELHDGDKCRWAKIGNILCAFNNGTLMLLSNGSDDISGLKETLMAYMRQTSEQSFCSTKDFEKLCEAKGEISMVANFSAMSSDMASQFKMGMPADLKLEDLKYLIDVTFEKGKIVCKAQSLISNKEIISTMNDLTKSINFVDDELLEYYPSNSLFWCGTSVKGGELYSVLCRNRAIEQMLDNPMMPVDISDIFSSVAGNVSVGYVSSMDNILFYAKVTRDDFLSSFDELIPLLSMMSGDMKLEKTSATAYHFSTSESSLWFGVKNGMLYITNNASSASHVCEKYSYSMRSINISQMMSGNRIFAYFNINQAISELAVKNNGIRMLMPVLSYFEDVTLKVPDWKGGQMDIIMKDKDINALQLVLRELQNI